MLPLLAVAGGPPMDAIIILAVSRGPICHSAAEQCFGAAWAEICDCPQLVVLRRRFHRWSHTIQNVSYGHRQGIDWLHEEGGLPATFGCPTKCV